MFADAATKLVFVNALSPAKQSFAGEGYASAGKAI